MDKPHQGRIKGWKIERRRTANFAYIYGEFLDHPGIRGPGWTSRIVSANFETGEVETKNSRYTLVDEGEPSRFLDFPMRGDKMVFLGENGYQNQLDEAFKIFSPGTVYEVEYCNVGLWDHYVKFVDIPGGPFNGVMFERVGEQK